MKSLIVTFAGFSEPDGFFILLRSALRRARSYPSSNAPSPTFSSSSTSNVWFT